MNAKPIDLLLTDGRKHFSKTEIESRREAEQEIAGSLGPGKLKMPLFVREDPVALARWRECIRLYRDCAFISASDSGYLAQYCMTWSEYVDLLEKRRVVSSIKFTEVEEAEISNVIDEERGKIAVNQLWKKIEFVLSVEGGISIDTALNKKNELLSKMADHLFLNPLAKIKAVPRRAKEKREESPLEKAGFGNV